MERLIDANAIRYDRLLKTSNKEHPLEWAVSQSAINSMPTVSQHVESVGKYGSALKHGHWIDGNGNPVSWDDRNIGCPSDSCYCSECGDWLTASDEYPAKGYYCPNCGAKMDEVEYDKG